ncbi:MAG: serine/threonine-protein kinase, partial [Bryobacteraceae bacterium]
MPLTTGSRVGPYEILVAIGAGGMGEVYKARDTRLDRLVAVKVSSAQFNQRFEREARAIAALNHPHICTLYDVGPDYLVMELIEGPTLAERITAGPVPLAEALAIARQITEALEAAHEKGIVHRDLKPANVKLTAEGQVKVLDFGLAKAFETEAPGGDPSVSPTVTMNSTRAGVILGTAQYMSPEQARGAVADKRADIWAFGVVLYEMLSGRRAFAGETISDTLAAVLKTDPDWSALPKETPPAVRRLLRR